MSSFESSSKLCYDSHGLKWREGGQSISSSSTQFDS